MTIESEGVRLAAHLARPDPAATRTAAPAGLVLGAGFPSGPGGGATSAQTYPAFADRLAAGTGWMVLTFNFRGTGTSEGNFSLRNWLADLDAARDWLVAEGV